MAARDMWEQSGYVLTTRMWDAATRQVTQQFSYDAIVMSVAFSPDGHTLTAGCENGTMSLWTIGAGETLTFAGSPGPVWSVMFSPDGNILAAGSDDPYQKHGSDTAQPTLRLWDLPSQRVATTLPRAGGYGHAMAGTAHMWDLDSRQVTILAGHSGINTVAFSPDGRTLATGSMDTTIRLRDCP